jgi:hypothetical protein
MVAPFDAGVGGVGHFSDKIASVVIHILPNGIGFEFLADFGVGGPTGFVIKIRYLFVGANSAGSVAGKLGTVTIYFGKV